MKRVTRASIIKEIKDRTGVECEIYKYQQKGGGWILDTGYWILEKN